jgi:hypothetical protein
VADDAPDFELTERAWQEMLMTKPITDVNHFLNITNNLEGKRLSLKLFDQWRVFHPDKKYPDNCSESDVRRYLGYRWQLKEKRSEKIMSQFKKIEAVILSNKPIYQEKKQMSDAIPEKAKAPAKSVIKPAVKAAPSITVKSMVKKKKFQGVREAVAKLVLEKKYTDTQIIAMMKQKFQGWTPPTVHDIIDDARWRIKKGRVEGVAAGTIIAEILPKK